MIIVFSYISMILSSLGIFLICGTKYEFIGGILLVASVISLLFINNFIDKLVDIQDKLISDNNDKLVQRIRVLEETLLQTSEQDILKDISTNADDIDKALDIMNKFDFFNQKGIKEWWVTKPEEVKEQDIQDYGKDINFVRNLLLSIRNERMK